MIGEEPRNLLTDPHGLIIQLLRERERIKDRRDGNRPDDNLAPDPIIYLFDKDLAIFDCLISHSPSPT